MQTPAVTVIIPNYNHHKFLRERIESVLNQSYTNFEVMIMDDCSTDASRQLIEEYRTHPKVTQIVYNQQNSGSTFKQWNKGVDMAHSELIWIAESDDVAHPDLLQTLVPPMLNNANLVLSYCQSLRINAESEVFANWLFKTDDLDKDLFRRDFIMSGQEYTDRFLIFRNTIPNASAVVFRKKAYQKVGGADAKIKYVADWLTWLKILNEGSLFYSAQMLNSFRYVESGGVIHSSGAHRTFYYQYDLIMRFAYKAFLQSLQQLPNALYQKNLRLLRKESRKEFKFLLRKGFYLRSLFYLKQAAFTRQ
ncbi:glycosyltransferase family A protein [Mucilaginibacter sp. PAMB04168]|uniref:glycosyltransferase family A protein n=1 Tax=Mucilaginibacter sp. PAMB04168 TaxID=3138567 RepID=UPI0031F61A61